MTLKFGSNKMFHSRIHMVLSDACSRHLTMDLVKSQMLLYSLTFGPEFSVNTKKNSSTNILRLDNSWTTRSRKTMCNSHGRAIMMALLNLSKLPWTISLKWKTKSLTKSSISSTEQRPTSSDSGLRKQLEPKIMKASVVETIASQALSSESLLEIKLWKNVLKDMTSPNSKITYRHGLIAELVNG